MGYSIGGISGSVIKGVSEAMFSQLTECFKSSSGTTEVEVFARTFDLTNVDYIDMHTKATDPVGNTTIRLKIDGATVHSFVSSGDDTETDIDVTAYSGEKRVSITIQNDNAGGTSNFNFLELNLRVGT